jgi:hypothetical protein
MRPIPDGDPYHAGPPALPAGLDAFAFLDSAEEPGRLLYGAEVIKTIAVPDLTPVAT